MSTHPKITKKEYYSNENKEIKECFDLLDPKKEGFIDSSKLRVAMKTIGLDSTSEELTTMINNVDMEGKGRVVYDDFLALMTAKPAKVDFQKEIKMAFNFMDEDETGKISFKNLKKIAKEMGETLSDQELFEFMKEGDLDGDGEVSLEEFQRIMTFNKIMQ